MARRKKVTVDVVAETQEVAMHPRRSGRKRKVISYADSDDEDGECNLSLKKKAAVEETESKTETETEIMAGKATVKVEAPILIGSSPPPPAERAKAKPKKRKSRKPSAHEAGYDTDGNEIRKKDYQAFPPEHFEAKRMRALSEPIFFTDRVRDDAAGYPREQFSMTGSTGSPYTVKIGLVLSCTCGDFTFRRNLCKHIIYVLHYALKVPLDSELLYQHALTTGELHQILNAANAVPVASEEDLHNDGNRKPIEDDCPICYMDFDPKTEVITYCKAKCGNNFHAKCINIWLGAQGGAYRKNTCPLCREQWAH